MESVGFFTGSELLFFLLPLFKGAGGVFLLVLGFWFSAAACAHTRTGGVGKKHCQHPNTQTHNAPTKMRQFTQRAAAWRST
jgi:hypothetical protein